MCKFGVKGLARLTLFVLAITAVTPVWAINIRIDYSRDGNNFFGAGNPDGATAGAQAKAALEAAAAFYSDALEDTFSSIDVPNKFYGSKGGEATYFWKRRFINPATGLNDAQVNAEFSENEYVIYAGARDLPGDALGLGGPGGFVGGFAVRVGEFTSEESADITATAAQFASESTKRGETSGFGRWGGSLAFDRPTNWHFDHTTNPGATERDFFSVALHELGHTLGLGASDEWNALVSGTGFTGANSLRIHSPSGNVPLASADDTGHWLQSIDDSPVYEGSGNQKPIMVPSIAPGVRRHLTNLDAAALADIGWEIDLPGANASAAMLASVDLSGGSSSVAALSASITPEPGSVILAVMAASGTALLRKRR
ncbi:MAG: matrixin family metalloprotease [Pirellulales bacterium]